MIRVVYGLNRYIVQVFLTKRSTCESRWFNHPSQDQENSTPERHNVPKSDSQASLISV